VILRTFGSQVKAQVVADHLESANIPVVVGADDCGGLLPVFSPVHGFHLLVKDADLPRAEEALRDIEAEFGIETKGTAREPGVPRLPSPRLAKLGYFVLGALVGALGYYAMTLWQSNYTGTWSEDFNGDGHPDVWWEYERGQLIKAWEDSDFDGRPENWHHHSKGIIQWSEEDTNDDGRPDVWWEYTHRYVTARRDDFDFDGKPDAETRFIGELPVETLFKSANQLGYWRRDFYTNGILRVTHLDRDRDGVLDERLLFDAFGTFQLVAPMK